MSKVSVLLLATTLAFGASTVVLHQKLQDSREQNEALRRATIEQDDQLSLADAAPTPDALDSTSASVEKPHARPAVLQPVAEPTDRSKDDDDGTKWAAQELSRLKDPKFRASVLARNRLGMEQRYPDLALILGLDDRERDEFLDVLAQQELERHERQLNEMLASRNEKESSIEARRERGEAIKAQIEDQQRAALGEARYQTWTDYVNTLPTRNAINQLRVKLVDAGVPLRADQVEPLVADLSEERMRHQAERDARYSGLRSQYNATPAEVIDHMNKRLKLIEEHLDRAHDIASAHLTSNQLELFDEMLEQQRKQARVETSQFTTSAKLEQRGQ